MSEFSHIDAEGNAVMVDVAAKADTKRTAIAKGRVILNEETFNLLKQQALPKGDALASAKIAGIMGAKETHRLIPLCHPIALSYVDVRFAINDAELTIEVEGEARCTGKTGVEMEALVAVQVACATIYDMCKAVQKDVIISDVRLVYKEGGKSGVFKAE
ncbi:MULTISPECIES: cyclic pyranopterin monophosphate synthase MoaC [Maridesulfovibrio]|uniref:Cyclic pyranopterin monophosphate synthase n=1 Tax=Maridesulfovibrio salexigens (strain ATCC 14822 / DSM 2638 / NCIMB 8403 / VKM B-1763) TaxID=526222 RepID=C6BYN4_MARSD|nr:cyclic pyranopterin monophosphate synthase MoaC [Maridesulfovibrio salexigens]ACS80641.1 molybdenum cofactor biosynthesis protein C [Maridesulfovibrio salexigens DSM 2638]